MRFIGLNPKINPTAKNFDLKNPENNLNPTLINLSKQLSGEDNEYGETIEGNINGILPSKENNEALFNPALVSPSSEEAENITLLLGDAIRRQRVNQVAMTNQLINDINLLTGSDWLDIKDYR